MKPEKIRGYVQEERDLRQRIKEDKEGYVSEATSLELSSEERFTVLKERLAALPGMESCFHMQMNEEHLEVILPESSKGAEDRLILQLAVSYGLFEKGQTEVGGEISWVSATWRDASNAREPIVQQTVYSDELTPAALSIIEDSVSAAEEYLPAGV